MRKNKAVFAAIATVVLATALSGCASSSSGKSTGDSKAPLTVWVDVNRAPQAEAYAKAHPKLKITVDTIDSTQGVNTSKISLAKKAGTGVPDVVFIATPDEITTLAANPINYPLALNGLVPKKTLDGFPKSTTSRCTFDGKVYCLPNDLAQTVLWYNKTLFDKFGYTVPTTFDQFKDLGIKLAAEHPGYSLGTVNGRYGYDAFFGSSGCPVTDATSLTEVHINTASSKCTRVGDVLAPLIKNGTLSTQDPFGKAYTAVTTSDHVLAMVNASWMGSVFIADIKGQYAAAPMPTWAGASKNWSSTVGGGVWIVSRTAKNQKAAVAFATYMTTNAGIAKKAATFPAYAPNDALWLSAQNNSAYALDPSEVMKDAAANVELTDNYVRYQTQLLDSFNATIVANGGTDMSGALQQFGQQATEAAKAAGYTVKK